ncbi:SusE domain-containing protein, partial [Lutibacter sp.]|uniref:SusE domain-containing protein n=1 Tax=Lutibacter sp. TaxID=1925666 RepID=UPI0035622041
MKYIHKIIVLFVFTIALISCDKNENFEILPAVESFQIVTPSSGTVIVLNDTNLDNNALFISWETLSDATGTFDIEVAQTGTDFATSYLLGTTEAKNFSMTVNEINTFLLDVMGLDPETAVSLDIRILNNGTMTDSISVVLTPYKVEYTELYVVGNITDPQWSPADALAMTRTDLNIFEITLVLADGAEFKFLPTNTGWDGDFGEDPNNPGMIIQDGESNLSGYTAGTYKITVNLNTFTFEVVEILSSPRLAVPGNHQGWSPSTAPQLEASSASTTDFEGYVWLNGEYKFVAADADGVFDWNKGPDYGD